MSNARLFPLLMVALLTACGRPPAPEERAFLQSLHGADLNLDRMRLVKGAPVGEVTFRRPARPRSSCREKIFPPRPAGEIVTSSPAAVALFNTVYFTNDWYLDNYLHSYPDRLALLQAMLFAHEATHVWQWQNRKRTGYHPLKAAIEHGRRRDPYLFELDTETRFLDYGYEQQATIVEEYICCRALDPTGARSQRLHALLGAELPLTPLPASREHDVYLPWKGAEVNGICS